MKNYIKSTDALISFLISMILSVTFWLLSPLKSVPLWSLVLSMGFAFVFLWLFLRKCFVEQTRQETIKVISFIQNHRGEFLCVVRSDNNLKHEQIVTLYAYEKNFESYFGTGLVINIQDDGLVQIAILHSIYGEKIIDTERFESLIKSRKLVIKPIVTNRYLLEIHRR